MGWPCAQHRQQDVHRKRGDLDNPSCFHVSSHGGTPGGAVCDGFSLVMTIQSWRNTVWHGTWLGVESGFVRWLSIHRSHQCQGFLMARVPPAESLDSGRNRTV
jgi:hypothetical protein